MTVLPCQPEWSSVRQSCYKTLSLHLVRLHIRCPPPHFGGHSRSRPNRRHPLPRLRPAPSSICTARRPSRLNESSCMSVNSFKYSRTNARLRTTKFLLYATKNNATDANKNFGLTEWYACVQHRNNKERGSYGMTASPVALLCGRPKISIAARMKRRIQ